MRITYDAELDALHIRSLETTMTTQHVAEGIVLDYLAESQLAGIEVLFHSCAAQYPPAPPLRSALRPSRIYFERLGHFRWGAPFHEPVSKITDTGNVGSALTSPVSHSGQRGANTTLASPSW
jgi:uncharacterized protein YuzE